MKMRLKFCILSIGLNINSGIIFPCSSTFTDSSTTQQSWFNLLKYIYLEKEVVSESSLESWFKNGNLQPMQDEINQSDNYFLKNEIKNAFVKLDPLSVGERKIICIEFKKWQEIKIERKKSNQTNRDQTKNIASPIFLGNPKEVDPRIFSPSFKFEDGLEFRIEQSWSDHLKANRTVISSVGERLSKLRISEGQKYGLNNLSDGWVFEFNGDKYLIGIHGTGFPYYFKIMSEKTGKFVITSEEVRSFQSHSFFHSLKINQEGLGTAIVDGHPEHHIIWFDLKNKTIGQQAYSRAKALGHELGQVVLFKNGELAVPTMTLRNKEGDRNIGYAELKLFFPHQNQKWLDLGKVNLDQDAMQQLPNEVHSFISDDYAYFYFFATKGQSYPHAKKVIRGFKVKLDQIKLQKISSKEELQIEIHHRGVFWRDKDAAILNTQGLNFFGNDYLLILDREEASKFSLVDLSEQTLLFTLNDDHSNLINKESPRFMGFTTKITEDNRLLMYGLFREDPKDPFKEQAIQVIGPPPY